MSSSMGRMTSHIWNGKKHVWNHQPVYNHQCWGQASQAVGLELEELNKQTAQNTNYNTHDSSSEEIEQCFQDVVDDIDFTIIEYNTHIHIDIDISSGFPPFGLYFRLAIILTGLFHVAMTHLLTMAGDPPWVESLSGFQQCFDVAVVVHGYINPKNFGRKPSLSEKK